MNDPLRTGANALNKAADELESVGVRLTAAEKAASARVSAIFRTVASEAVYFAGVFVAGALVGFALAVHFKAVL